MPLATTLNVALAPPFTSSEKGCVVMVGAATVLVEVEVVLEVELFELESFDPELELLPALVDELPVSDPITFTSAKMLGGSAKTAAANTSEVRRVDFMGGWV